MTNKVIQCSALPYFQECMHRDDCQTQWHFPKCQIIPFTAFHFHPLKNHQTFFPGWEMKSEHLLWNGLYEVHWEPHEVLPVIAAFLIKNCLLCVCVLTLVQYHIKRPQGSSSESMGRMKSKCRVELLL